MKLIFSKSCPNQILGIFSSSVFCVDFELPKKLHVFFHIYLVGAMMPTFDTHALSRMLTLKFYQKMQNVIEINIQEKNDNFLAIWPLAAIQKAKNCHFSQISELTQSMQIIYQNEALGINFSEKLMSRSSEVIRGQKSR